MSLINPYNKTRLAPTPSGFLHPGNVLSFAITAVLARKTGAKILLRVDDLDQARVNKLYVQDIFDTLNFLDIPWDEGPRNVNEFEDSYSQKHRMALYNEALQRLADEEKVFACTCSRSQLQNYHSCNCFNEKIPLDTKNASWRLITNNHPELEVKSYPGKTIRTFLPADMKNFIVKKKDGFPAYQLTSVVDDLFYGVDLIVRGEDLWPSTLAQHVLASALGGNNFNDITFYHHQLLMDAEGKKLSKSAGALSIKYLRESGKTPADIFGFIAAMAGIEETADNWEQLAMAVIKF
ncbi:MAG TPA: tRNA glutamyl-Q synthetase [Mucilaginibacter sp.]|jgi:glutamyl-tRNA synthetase|nr:tRNA glutamyl-Q synthetase [Mucilaginibacter sp.]